MDFDRIYIIREKLNIKNEYEVRIFTELMFDLNQQKARAAEGTFPAALPRSVDVVDARRSGSQFHDAYLGGACDRSFACKTPSASWNGGNLG